MRSRPCSARLRSRSALPTLVAGLLLAAAPAAALSTFFAEDLGDGEVPSSFPNSSAMEAQFLAQLGSSQTEDFEGFGVADHGPLSIFAGGPITGTLSDSVADSGSIRDFFDADRGFPISGDRFWKNTTTADADDDLFRVTFNQQVRAFGFYATAWATEGSPNDDATQLSLYLLRQGMPAERVEILHDQRELPGGVFYFGVIADLPFDAVALRNDSTTDPGDRIGFDDFTVSIVPEPSTLALLALGLIGVAALRARG